MADFELTFEELSGYGCVHAKLAAIDDAIENIFESAQFKSALSTAIDAATAPLVLTAAQKRRAVFTWARRRLIG